MADAKPQVWMDDAIEKGLRKKWVYKFTLRFNEEKEIEKLIKSKEFIFRKLILTNSIMMDIDPSKYKYTLQFRRISDSLFQHDEFLEEIVKLIPGCEIDTARIQTIGQQDDD